MDDSCAAYILCSVLELLRLWWSWTSSDECASAGPTARLTRTDRPWSEHATAGAFEAYSSEQRGALSRAAGWLEGARGTDKVRWTSRSCRGRSREQPRRPRQACARCMCVATRARALSRGCSRATCACALWQALGSLQAVFHESTTCISML